MRAFRLLRIERDLRHLAPDVGTENERNHDEYLLLGEVEFEGTEPGADFVAWAVDADESAES